MIGRDDWRVNNILAAMEEIAREVTLSRFQLQ
jgi:hypothetical protein